VIGGLVGGISFYFPSAYVGCDWLWQGSNMCGLPAMMIMAPLGAIAGAIVGGRLAGRTID